MVPSMRRLFVLESRPVKFPEVIWFGRREWSEWIPLSKVSQFSGPAPQAGSSESPEKYRYRRPGLAVCSSGCESCGPGSRGRGATGSSNQWAGDCQYGVWNFESLFLLLRRDVAGNSRCDLWPYGTEANRFGEPGDATSNGWSRNRHCRFGHGVYRNSADHPRNYRECGRR